MRFKLLMRLLLMKVLGLETSVMRRGSLFTIPKNGLIKATNLFSNCFSMQNTVEWVPELATRDHVRKTFAADRECAKAGMKKSGARFAIAYTSGPGLVGALMRADYWSIH